MQVLAILGAVTIIVLAWVLISEHLENACYTCPKCGRNTLRVTKIEESRGQRISGRWITWERTIGKCRSCGYDNTSPPAT